MDELLDFGVGFMFGGVVLGLMVFFVDDISMGGFMATMFVSAGAGCIAAAKWRDALQAIANRGWW